MAVRTQCEVHAQRSALRRGPRDLPAALDIGRLRRRGLFRPGTVVPVMLTEPGGEVAMLKVSARGQALHVETYRAQASRAAQTSVRTLRLTFSDLTFGRRAFLVCPSCRSSRGALYADQGSFRCRRCVGLTYRSQQQGRLARALQKAKRLHTELGGTGDLSAPILDPPRGMRMARFVRLKIKLERALAKIVGIERERAILAERRASRRNTTLPAAER